MTYKCKEDLRGDEVGFITFKNRNAKNPDKDYMAVFHSMEQFLKYKKDIEETDGQSIVISFIDCNKANKNV